MKSVSKELEERFPSLVTMLENEGHTGEEIERILLQAIDLWLVEHK